MAAYKLTLANDEGEVIGMWSLDSSTDVTAESYMLPLRGFGKDDLAQSINLAVHTAEGK